MAQDLLLSPPPPRHPWCPTFPSLPPKPVHASFLGLRAPLSSPSQPVHLPFRTLPRTFLLKMTLISPSLTPSTVLPLPSAALLVM